MRRATLVLAMVLLPAVQAAGSQAYEFHAPAQWAGDLEVASAQWALFVLGPSDHAIADMHTVGPQWIGNHSTLRLEASNDRVGTFNAAPMPPTNWTQAGDSRGDIRFDAPGWKSLYVEADSLRLTVGGAGTVAPILPGAAAEAALGTRNYPDATIHRGHHRSAALGVGIATGEGRLEAATWTLEATGLRSIEWHNGTVGCSADACWPSSTTERRTLAGNGASILHYTEVEPAGGDLTAAGSAWALGTGGPALDVGVVGELRLPGLRSVEGCAGCLAPDGQTLSTVGTMWLRNLRPGRSEDLSARIHLEAGSARLDEAFLDPTVLGAAGLTATALAATGVLVLLVKMALPLFTRIRQDESLANPRRRQVMDAVQASPGLTLRGVSRTTGIAPSSVRHHVNILKRLGMVLAIQRGRALRHYAEGTSPSLFEPLALLQDPICVVLCTAIGRMPGVIQRDLLAACPPALPRSSVQYKLHQLIRSDVVRMVRIGRRTLYSPGKHFPNLLSMASAPVVGPLSA